MKKENEKQRMRGVILRLIVLLIGLNGLSHLMRGGIGFSKIHFEATKIEVTYEGTDCKAIEKLRHRRLANMLVTDDKEQTIVDYIHPETGKYSQGVLDYGKAIRHQKGAVSEGYWYKEEAPILTKQGMRQSLFSGIIMLLIAAIGYRLRII